MEEVVLLNDLAVHKERRFLLKFIGRAHKEIDQNKQKKLEKPFMPTCKLKEFHKMACKKKYKIPTQIKESFLF